MAKIIRFDDSARGALRRGIDQMANAVAATLGPRGRSVALHLQKSEPVLTNDGLTIAQHIELSDPHENLGVQLLREVASKTLEVAGDGTTTATLLAQAIVTAGLVEVDEGRDPHQLKRGIDLAVSAVVDHLDSQAQKVDGLDSLTRFAQHKGLDEADAKLIATALSRVGSLGGVELESGEGLESELNWVIGHQIESGYLSPYFINEPETMEVVLDRPYILFHDRKVSELSDIVPILEQIAEKDASLLIIAEDVDSEALATLVMNRLRGTLNVAAAKAPGFGERRREQLKDLAVMTGGTVFGSGRGCNLATAELSDLGRAGQVLMTKETTTILEGAGKVEEIEKRWLGLEAQIDATESEYAREKLILRRARLRGEIAVLIVGGDSDLDIADRRGRLFDVLSATRVAMGEGIVPGGGVALLRAGSALGQLEGGTESEQAGIQIVRQALQAPAHKIAENAGFDGDAIVRSILTVEADRGFNVETAQEEALFESGIVDSTRVTRVALQNAASIGSLILTTETLVAEDSGDNDERAAS